MKNRNANPPCPMVTVQIDVPAGSPWIARKNERIAAEKDFERAFITLPTLLDQEARRYVSEVDERCAVTVHPPLDVLTERARYFVKIEHPMDATLNPEELKHRLNALVRAAWAPQRSRILELSLASRGSPEDVALATSGKGAPDSAGNASDSGVAIPTSSPVQPKSDSAQSPPPLSSLDAGTAAPAASGSKAALSTEGDELRSDSDGVMRESDFTRDGSEAEAATMSGDATRICTGAIDGTVPANSSGVDDSPRGQNPASGAREERRPDPFELEPQVHPEESFFCTNRAVVFVIETDNPLLPCIIVEANGEELPLQIGECLPGELVLEWITRPIKWINVIRVID